MNPSVTAIKIDYLQNKSKPLVTPPAVGEAEF